jgi:hypothetical protein
LIRKGPLSVASDSGKHLFQIKFWYEIKNIKTDIELLKFSILAGAVYTFNIFYCSTSAFIFRDFFHLSVLVNGYIYIFSALSVIVGTIFLKMILRYIDKKNIGDFSSLALCFVTVFIFLLYGYFKYTNVEVFILLISIAAFNFGILFPLYISEGLTNSTTDTRVVSSFQVFMRVLVAVVIGGSATYLPRISVFEVTFILLLIAIGVFIISRISYRKTLL